MLLFGIEINYLQEKQKEEEEENQRFFFPKSICRKLLS